jgi:choline dehydrogenase-like flavoprotein
VIEDLHDLPQATNIAADVCLIGAGAAGITIARELAQRSVSVCLVEGGGMQFEYLESQTLYQGSNTGVPVSFEGGRLRFFGGSTNHWGGRCAPLDDIDFRRRDWIDHSGWPLDRADLDPYYRRAQKVAGFRTEWLSDTDTLANLNVTLPALDETRLAPFLWHYAPAMKDAPAWRWANAYGPELRESKHVRVLLHANFAGFSTDKNHDRVKTVSVRTQSGVTATIAATDFVLCCGGIENARLLLLGGEQNNGSFGNQNDLVGRYLMQHSRGPAAVVVGAGQMHKVQEQFNILRTTDGLEVEVGMTLAPQLQEQERLLNCSGVLVYQGDPDSGIAVAQDIWRALLSGHWAPDMGEKVGLIARDFPDVARTVSRRLSSGYSLDREGAAVVPSKSATLLLDLEQAPDRESRISLSDARDALGLKRVQANWRIGELERRTAARFTGLVAAEFARLGIGRCRLEPWLRDANVPMTNALQETYHYLGTTRMADNPQDGVVDRDCAVHGMKNLYVAGSSVFPTAGQANPTLTLVALALRLADRLSRRG